MATATAGPAHPRGNQEVEGEEKRCEGARVALGRPRGAGSMPLAGRHSRATAKSYHEEEEGASTEAPLAMAGRHRGAEEEEESRFSGANQAPTRNQCRPTSPSSRAAPLPLLLLLLLSLCAIFIAHDHHHNQRRQVLAGFCVSGAALGQQGRAARQQAAAAIQVANSWRGQTKLASPDELTSTATSTTTLINGASLSSAASQWRAANEASAEQVAPPKGGQQRRRRAKWDPRRAHRQPRQPQQPSDAAPAGAGGEGSAAAPKQLLQQQQPSPPVSSLAEQAFQSRLMELRQKYMTNQAINDRAYYILLAIYALFITFGTISNGLICLMVSSLWIIRLASELDERPIEAPPLRESCRVDRISLHPMALRPHQARATGTQWGRGIKGAQH